MIFKPWLVAPLLAGIGLGGCGDPQARARAQLLRETHAFFDAIDEQAASCYAARDLVRKAQADTDYDEMRRAAAEASPTCQAASTRLENLVLPHKADSLQAVYFRQARRTCANSISLAAQQLAVIAEPANVRSNNLFANGLGQQSDDEGRRCEAETRATLEYLGLKRRSAP